MKTQSTYSLLVKSKETGRSIFEGLVYGTIVLSTVISILQFASQTVTVPASLGSNSTSATFAAQADTTAASTRG